LVNVELAGRLAWPSLLENVTVPLKPGVTANVNGPPMPPEAVSCSSYGLPAVASGRLDGQPCVGR
jgi:hypothetical protein